jgi:hypothetical protein
MLHGNVNYDGVEHIEIMRRGPKGWEQMSDITYFCGTGAFKKNWLDEVIISQNEVHSRMSAERLEYTKKFWKKHGEETLTHIMETQPSYRWNVLDSDLDNTRVELPKFSVQHSGLGSFSLNVWTILCALDQDDWDDFVEATTPKEPESNPSTPTGSPKPDPKPAALYDFHDLLACICYGGTPDRFLAVSEMSDSQVSTLKRWIAIMKQLLNRAHGILLQCLDNLHGTYNQPTAQRLVSLGHQRPSDRRNMYARQSGG